LQGSLAAIELDGVTLGINLKKKRVEKRVLFP
jgi:hypothetical protein